MAEVLRRHIETLEDSQMRLNKRNHYFLECITWSIAFGTNVDSVGYYKSNEISKTCVIMKLSPSVWMLPKVPKAAEDAGADALSYKHYHRNED